MRGRTIWHGIRIHPAIEAHLKGDVPFDGIVHQHAAWLLSLEHVDDRWKLFVFDSNLLRDILSFCPRRRIAHRHELSDIA